MLFGFGSMILNSLGYEFRILMWMGDGAGPRILIGFLGLILFGISMLNEKSDQPETNDSNEENAS